MDDATMIEIKHARTTFTVRPENGQAVHDALARLAKGKGPKLPKPKGNPKYDSGKREYPVFYPGMETGEYLNKYHELNEKKMLSGLSFTFANRPAPMLDPSYPEVTVEPAAWTAHAMRKNVDGKADYLWTRCYAHGRPILFESEAAALESARQACDDPAHGLYDPQAKEATQ